MGVHPTFSYEPNSPVIDKWYLSTIDRRWNRALVAQGFTDSTADSWERLRVWKRLVDANRDWSLIQPTLRSHGHNKLIIWNIPKIR